MRFSEKGGDLRKERRDRILAAVMGAVVFFMLFGFSAIDINGCRLFSEGDPCMHYLGWRFFREAPWQAKIGLMNNIHYPYSISVIFTDSIPLMAVIFKVFREILPEYFNYFGLWTLFSFVLQGYFAFKILSLYTGDRMLKFTGTLFFILTPALIKRCFWHTALTSHFLILAALLILFDKKIGKEVLRFAVLGLLCGSIHLYFLGICGMIAFFTAVDRLRREMYSPVKCMSIPIIFGVAGAFTVWILGGFDSGMNEGAPGFGDYSFNLNSFFNGNYWSRYLNLPYYDDSQVEGFSYLGLGMLAVLLISCVFILSSFLGRTGKTAGIPAEDGGKPEDSSVSVYVVLFIFSLIFAVSNNITFSQRLIFSFDISDSGPLNNLCSLFRSSGRFAWTDIYLLMTGGFFILSKAGEKFMGEKGSEGERSRRAAWIVFLLLLIYVQISDLYPGISAKAMEIRSKEEYRNILNDSYLDELASSGKYRHMVFMDKGEFTHEELFALSFLAVDNDMTINDFEFGRQAFLNTEELAAQSAKEHPGDCIYIFSGGSGDCSNEYPELDLIEVDPFIVGT